LIESFDPIARLKRLPYLKNGIVQKLPNNFVHGQITTNSVSPNAPDILKKMKKKRSNAPKSHGTFRLNINMLLSWLGYLKGLIL